MLKYSYKDKTDGRHYLYLQLLIFLPMKTPDTVASN
jgi:hypothetical protein